MSALGDLRREVDRLREINAEIVESHNTYIVLLSQSQAREAVLRKAVEGLAARWEGWAETRSTLRIDAFRDAAEDLRAALASALAPTDRAS